jgi:hypothetical protein
LNLHSTIPSFYGQHCALRRESLDIAFHMGKNDTDREARKLYKTAQSSNKVMSETAGKVPLGNSRSGTNRRCAGQIDAFGTEVISGVSLDSSTTKRHRYISRPRFLKC